MGMASESRQFDSQLLDKIEDCAKRHGLSAEAWLKRKVDGDARIAGLRDGDEDESVVFDMIRDHFHDLRLGIDAQRSLAKVMLDTIENGEPHDVDQLGPRQCRYQFRRRSGSLSIRVGQGKVGLSLPYAMRLVSTLDPLRSQRGNDHAVA